MPHRIEEYTMSVRICTSRHRILYLDIRYDTGVWSRQSTKLKDTVSFVEIDDLICKATGYMKNFIGRAFRTGMWPGESIALRWSDVFLNSSQKPFYSHDIIAEKFRYHMEDIRKSI